MNEVMRCLHVNGDIVELVDEWRYYVGLCEIAAMNDD
jgi:hypothetical protein